MLIRDGKCEGDEMQQVNDAMARALDQAEKAAALGECRLVLFWLAAKPARSFWPAVIGWQGVSIQRSRGNAGDPGGLS